MTFPVAFLSGLRHTVHMADTQTLTITHRVATAAGLMDTLDQLATSEFGKIGVQWVRNYLRAVATGDGAHADMAEYAIEVEAGMLVDAGEAALRGERGEVIQHLRAYVLHRVGA